LLTARGLLRVADREARRGAGAAITGASPQEQAKIPAYLRHLAALDSDESCGERKAALADLITANDQRAMPALQVIEASPRDQCSARGGKADCYGCMREDLQLAATVLEMQKDGNVRVEIQRFER